MDDHPPPASLRQRWLRDGRNLLLLSLPFALAAGLLALLSDREDGDYWHAMDLALFAIAAAGAWAAAMLAYLLWGLWRDGLQASSLPAVGILAAALLAGAAWETGAYNASARCHADEAFYASLARLAPQARHDAIARAGPLLRAPSTCGADALALWFGATPMAPPGGVAADPATRHDVLARLLAQGLPPDDRLLYRLAAIDGDAAATRLVIERRLALQRPPDRQGGAQPMPGKAHWPAFPAALVEGQLLPRAQPCRAGLADADALRARAVLKTLVAAVPDGAQALPERARAEIACLGHPGSAGRPPGAPAMPQEAPD